MIHFEQTQRRSNICRMRIFPRKENLVWPVYLNAQRLKLPSYMENRLCKSKDVPIPLDAKVASLVVQSATTELLCA